MIYKAAASPGLVVSCFVWADRYRRPGGGARSVHLALLSRLAGEDMARESKRSGLGLWLRLVAAGLAAVAGLATAADGGGHGAHVTVTDPAGCVVLRVTP